MDLTNDYPAQIQSPRRRLDYFFESNGVMPTFGYPPS